jgi:hypothetical protein
MSPTYGYNWGTTPTFSVPGYTPPPTANINPRFASRVGTFGPFTNPATDYFANKGGTGGAASGFALTPASYGPPPTTMPVGKVSNWKDFMQGLLGTGVQYLLQKDAQKRADKLQQQGVDAQVVPNPGGGYSVQERPSFLKSPAGIALILGGGALVVYLMTRRKR